jgi:hypothetical protein
MEDSTTLRLGTARQNLRWGAVGFQDTTNYHIAMPKAATPQFLLFEIVVLTSFSRAAGATHEARFFLIAAFCRLGKSLSHSELMGWLIGAVGIEPGRPSNSQ